VVGFLAEQLVGGVLVSLCDLADLLGRHVQLVLLWLTRYQQ